MATLKEKLAKKIDEHRPRTTKLLKEFGKVKIDEVTIAQAIGGMRGIKSLVTDISYLDPFEGIRFRGFTIPETMAMLPKPAGAEMPFVEGHFYLLLTGEVPTDAEIKVVVDEFQARKKVPQYVFDTLKAMGKDSHPMTMFSAAILTMQKDSLFVKAYNDGSANRMNYWEFFYEDCMNLLAKLPEIGDRTQVSTSAETSPT
jgi:citrate synthase